MNKYKQGDTWWQQAIFYHIYPQSYYDSNGDGIGDLQGIRQKLSYLQDLGVDAIWLSPVFLSPLMDEGYDIADYTSIHPRYGTLDDFKQLLYEAHQMNIRLILDLVLNHTSDMHPWFMEARSSVDHPRRNWYLWHPGRKGRRPNNWMTNFGGSAWKKDEATGEYYHHSFFPEQPDLNWRNPEVKKAMFNIIRFWMTLGVDGFRLDVANLLFKHSDYPDNPIWALVADRNVYNRNQPETYELLRDFRALLNRFQGRIGIGEIYVSPPGNSCLAASFTGNGEDMLHMAFDFTLVFTRWSANAFYKVIRRYYKALPEKGWPCFVFSNHDLGRGVNHYLFPAGKEQKAKILATLLLTLRGTPFIYYGDEIGMQNRRIPRSRIRDRYGRLFYPFYTGRDKCCTPMQWNDSSYAGFSRATPWLPVHPDYKTDNVRIQKGDDNSIWNYYRQLIRLRRNYPVLQSGEIHFLNKGERMYLLYERSMISGSLWIAVNFSPFSRKIKEWRILKGKQVVLSTHPERAGKVVGEAFTLSPYESVLIKSI